MSVSRTIRAYQQKCHTQSGPMCSKVDCNEQPQIRRFLWMHKMFS
jgi:hypothetical protein